jgi:hypothetical protein
MTGGLTTGGFTTGGIWTGGFTTGGFEMGCLSSPSLPAATARLPASSTLQGERGSSRTGRSEVVLHVSMCWL